MTVIKHDTISIAFSIIAIMLLIFLSTFGADLMLRAGFSVLLILSGLALSRMTGNLEIDDDIDPSEGISIMKWFMISVGIIVMLAMYVPKIPLSLDNLSSTELLLVPRMFAVLMAISEEIFFRGFVTNFFITKFSLSFGILASGVFFGIYHLAVYGTEMSIMMYVVGAGLILSYVAVKTGRTSTTMLAHVLVNAISG